MHVLVVCSGDEDEHLPSAHTCFNMLDLPVSETCTITKPRLSSLISCLLTTFEAVIDVSNDLTSSFFTSSFFLQAYSSKDILRARLLKALQFTVGFGLV